MIEELTLEQLISDNYEDITYGKYLDNCALNAYIASLYLTHDPESKVPFFKMSSDLSAYGRDTIIRVMSKYIPDLRSMSTVRKNMMAHILWHIYVSARPHYDNPSNRKEKVLTEGYNLALSNAFIKNRSKWMHQILRELKDNQYVVYRTNKYREGMAERYLINSSFYKFMDSIYESFYLFTYKEVALKKDSEETNFYKEEYKNSIEKIKLTRTDLGTKEEFLEKLANETELTIDETPFKTFEAMGNKLPKSPISASKLIKKTNSYSKFGRVHLADNRQNLRSGSKESFYRELGYEKVYNYDISSSHINILRYINSEFISSLNKESRSSLDPTLKELNEDMVADCLEMEEYMSNYLNESNDDHSKHIGIPSKLLKRAIYSALNMADISNPYSSFQVQLRDMYPRYNDRIIITKKILELPIFKVFDFYHENIGRYNLCRLTQEGGRTPYLNGITNITYITPNRKNLMTYYLQGYEAWYIKNLIKLCQEKGITVLSDEHDGLITDKPIPQDIIELNKILTIPLDIRLKSL